jgi:hypothetical protein
MFTALLVPWDAEGNIAAYQKLKSNKTLRAVAPLLSAEVTQRYLKRTGEVKTQGGQAQWAKWYAQKKAGAFKPIQKEPDERKEEAEMVVPDVLLEDAPKTSHAYLEFTKKSGDTVRSPNVLIRKK